MEENDFKWVIRYLTPVNTLIYCPIEGACVKLTCNNDRRCDFLSSANCHSRMKMETYSENRTNCPFSMPL